MTRKPTTVAAGKKEVLTVLEATRVLVGVAARSIAPVAEDITLPQYRALVLLWSRGEQRPIDLALALDASSSAITRMCDRLVRKGLISRVPRQGIDRREARVALTGDGRRLITRVMGKRQREITSILGRLDRHQRELVVEGMSLFVSVAAPTTDAVATQESWTL